MAEETNDDGEGLILDASVIRGQDRHRDKKGLIGPAFCLTIAPGEANFRKWAMAHEKNPYLPGNPAKIKINCPVIADGRQVAMADCTLLINALLPIKNPSPTGV